MRILRRKPTKPILEGFAQHTALLEELRIAAHSDSRYMPVSTSERLMPVICRICFASIVDNPTNRDAHAAWHEQVNR